MVRRRFVIPGPDAFPEAGFDATFERSWVLYHFFERFVNAIMAGGACLRRLLDRLQKRC